MQSTGCFMNVLILTLTVMALLLTACTQTQPAQTPPTTTESTTTTTVTTTETAPTTTTEAVETPEGLSFKGKVLEIDGDQVLMECHDKTKFDTVWVNVALTDATPQIGQEYTVFYEDMVMPSLPPRITAVRMTLLFSDPLTE